MLKRKGEMLIVDSKDREIERYLIPLGSIIHRWFNLDFDKPDMPHVRRWYDTISQRPAVQKWVLIEMQ